MIKQFFEKTGYLLFACLLFFGNKPAEAQAPVFTIGSAANVASGTVVIPVTTQNFSQVLAWQGSINWDNSKLTYASVSTPVSQLNGMQFNATINSSTGRLNFIWLNNDLVAQTIPDNTVLFNITFNVVPGATDSTAIIFTNSPTQLLLSDPTGAAITNVTYTNGMVSFPRTIIPPELIIGSAVNVNTSSLVIPVTTKNFAQILAMQGSVNWDNNKLTFVGVSAPVGQLSGLQTSASVNITTGRLSFIWLDNNLTPQTIADNTVLFNITFNVVAAGANGSTGIVFSNTPTQLLLSDAGGATINNVVYTNGSVSFTGAVLAPQFTIGSANNVNTATVSIPVTAKNFVQLLAMQGSLNWDNSQLTYSSVSAPFAQLNGMLFNASVNGNTGQLSYIWTDNNLLPQTITDSTVLFTLTFNVAPGASGITNIVFSNTPSSLLVSNAGFSAVANVVYMDGSVSFSKSICAGGGSTTFTADLTGISYQWQSDAGTGAFSNINDNSNYTGTTSQILSLNNLPTAWAGYKYRCIVNGVNSVVFTISFTNYWIGTVSAAWETAANWSCGTVPGIYSDVIINAGSNFNPVLSSNVACRSVKANSSTVLTIKTGFNLTLTGK